MYDPDVKPQHEYRQRYDLNELGHQLLLHEMNALHLVGTDPQSNWFSRDRLNRLRVLCCRLAQRQFRDDYES